MFGWKSLGVMVVVASACSDGGPNVEFGETGSGGTGSGAGGAPEVGAGGNDEGGEGGAVVAAGGSSRAGGGGAAPSDAGGSGGVPSETAGATSEGGTSSGGAPSGGCGESGGGSESGGEAGGPAADALPGSSVYVPGQLLEFRLTLDPSDQEHLEEHGNDETFVPAAVAVSGSKLEAVEFAKVGVRHKGAWSLHHCWDDHGGVRYREAECQKLSYKVKFSEYDEDGRLDGMKRINLHAASGDATKLRELVAYATFADAGLRAPRTTPARVYVNGELQGLFIAVEEVDGRFTKAHFPEQPEGNLYKEAWPHPSADAVSFINALETNEAAADVSGIMEFAQAIGDATASSFVEDMEPFVDVDSVLRYLAVDRAIRNWDGITAFYSPVTPHNFFWYHEAAGGRFHLIPWDLDNTLWDYDPYMQALQTPPIPNINVAPLHCDPRPVWTPENPVRVTAPRCDPFLNLLTTTRWQRFVEIGRELREGPLSAAQLNAKVAYWRSQIVGLVDLDPTLNLGAWQTEVNRMPFVFEGMLADFDTLLGAGLVEETPPVDPVPEPTADELNVTTANDGLYVAAVTNFEFEAAATEIVGASARGSSAEYEILRNTEAPISGAADLLLNFTFTRAPGAYNEWLDLSLATADETDARRFQYIVMTLATDVDRTVRVRVESAAYAADFGGAWSEFGAYVSAGPSPRRIVVPVSSLTYPAWARAAWSGGSGWMVSDEEARSRVLERFTGLIFVPLPTQDAEGELVAETESGHLRIDNVYFR